MIITKENKIRTPEECESIIQERLTSLGISEAENISVFYDVLGLTMKKIRMRRRKTQQRVGQWLGVTFQQIQKYENGINRVPFHSILIFVEKMKCDISEFTKYFDGVILSTNAKKTQTEIINEQPNA